MMSSFVDYHKSRGNSIYRMRVGIPRCVNEILPQDKHARILDIGCGNGSFLCSLKMSGYTCLMGIDLDPEAVRWVKRNNIPCKCTDIQDYKPNERFDFVSMNHVLEHLPKDKVIPTLSYIHDVLLNSGGTIMLRIPNGQSNTGCYWAYEDFTHNTLFTAGSVEYVLKMGGFSDVMFIDERGLSQYDGIEKLGRELLLRIYERRIDFWNSVTGGAYHAPSKRIYTWEIKAIARKD